ncbi:WXG100 family type VII secretion target [Microbispora bryophytorum]|uniref:WXG100 family type VII secretion target n=1 Tax=Microbispora bryophytorum TaxID=1460882 RepID=UPI0033F3EBDB
MGAEAGWEPIKVYTSVDGLDPNNLSREQIKQKLDAASPDTVRRAGQAFIDAADLVGGKVGGSGPSEVGIQAALSRTAKELAAVWRGPAAEEVQSALRALYATAGALGDAMTASGAAMSWYADVVSDAKTNFPAGPSGSGGSNEGAGGGTNGTPSPYPSPPLSSSSSSRSFSTPAPSPGAMPYPDGDEAARAHFRKLNQQIQEANNAFAEGLAFELPAVEPLHIDLANSPRIHVGGTGAPTTTSDGVWHGGSYGDGTTGSGSTGSGSGGSGSGGGGQSGGGSGGTDGSGAGGSGSGGTGSGTGGGTGGGDTGSGGGGADRPGGTGDPGAGDPGAGGAPGAGQPGTGQPGGSGDGSGTAPAVIGGGSTELATTHPLPGATAPAGTTPHALTGYPDPRIPLPTAGPTGTLPPGGVIGVYGGARTGYGAGAAVEGGGLLGGYRAAQGGAGSSFLPYAPAAGGAGTGGQDEREREIYDPEPDVWRVTSTISPDRIG